MTYLQNDLFFNDILIKLPGHGFVEHFSALVFLPTHSFPPFIACCTIDLDEVLMPPPQVREHDVHTLNLDHLQSTFWSS